MYSTSQLGSRLVSVYNQPVARISFELFLSLALVITLTVVAIQPTLTTIARLNAEVQEKKELQVKLTQKVTNLRTATDTYNRNRERIGLLDQALPPDPRLMSTVKTVEKIAGESNVIITGLGISKVPDEASIEQQSTAKEIAELTDLPLSVSVVGNYQDIRQFVEKLHQSRRIMRVISATFSVEENRSDKLLQASLIVNAPYYGNGNQSDD